MRELGNIKDAFTDIDNEVHEMGCTNPGNQVFQVLDGIPEVEIDKSRENNEIIQRRIWAPQIRGGFNAVIRRCSSLVVEDKAVARTSGEIDPAPRW